MQKTKIEWCDNISDYIQSQRTAHAYSQRQLAKLSELSNSTVSRIEAGRVNVEIKSLVAILAVFGLELYFGVVPMKNDENMLREFPEGLRKGK